VSVPGAAFKRATPRAAFLTDLAHLANFRDALGGIQGTRKVGHDLFVAIYRRVISVLITSALWQIAVWPNKSEYNSPLSQ
jgi:hypothetical protein